MGLFFFFSSRRRHTRCSRDWSSDVCSSDLDGSADAQLNVEDLIKTFGASYLQSQGGRFLMFLDVEGSPSLSTEYYIGWARTLVDHSQSFSHGAVTVLPGVYATQADDTTWRAVA